MAIVDVEHARDLAAWSGRALGATPWNTITQATIGAFASRLHTTNLSIRLDGVVCRSSIIGHSSNWKAMDGPARSRARA